MGSKERKCFGLVDERTKEVCSVEREYEKRRMQKVKKRFRENYL